MMRPPRPNATKPPLGNASNSNNPFASVLNDDGDDDAATKQPVVLSDGSSSDSDDSDSSSSDRDSESSRTTHTTTRAAAGRQRPPRPSTAAARASLHPPRNRRRSSARFLNLNGSGTHHRRDSLQSTTTHSTATGGGRHGETTPAAAAADLSELYQKAIRMNAENKINAGNSWNLRLIENIDMFLGDEDEEDDDDDDDDSSVQSHNSSNNNDSNARSNSNNNNSRTTKNKKRVNFTKASCTLDASVKIYSYRVDDVHLTSYRVLANLNRSEGGGSKNSQKDGGGDTEQPAEGRTKSSSSSSNHHGSTLETHVANINLNKLDSAFDIDPLFHKMSKSFDEGGAKGLLLVNLGVGEQGCNIVFDSASDEAEEETTAVDHNNNNHNGDDDGDDETASNQTAADPRLPEGPMDITSLTQKLESLLLDENSTIRDLPLVPQLTGLRAEQESLEREGLVEAGAVMHTVGPKTPGRRRRYHAGLEEERRAERTIHKEALERSRRRSAGAVNLAARLQGDGDGGDDNFGGGGGDDPFGGDDDDGLVDFGGGGGAFDDGIDDDDDDDGFDAFIQQNAPRYSDISFSSAANSNNNKSPGGNRIGNNSNNSTANLLDAIASGQTVLAESDYSYFNEASQNGNLWAGAAHWKRAASKQPPGTAKKKKPATKSATKKKPKAAKKKAVTALVSLDGATPDLSHLFAKKGKRKTSAASSTTQWSKAMVTKHTAQENLLPEDAQVKVEQLTQLFLRPNTVLKASTAAASGDATTADIDDNDDDNNNVKNKTVMFNLPDWDDGSFGGGGDDDGPGFDFGGGGGDNFDDDDDDDDDDFQVRELDGVRKVHKVQVGYAVVAKKVDVKRLKRDLWMELEQKFGKTTKDDDDKSVDSSASSLGSEEDAAAAADTSNKPDDGDKEEKVVSFRDTVDDLEQQKTQMDVTLPFYFICILHLANEKGLGLTSRGLDDFTIHES